MHCAPTQSWPHVNTDTHLVTQPTRQLYTGALVLNHVLPVLAELTQPWLSTVIMQMYMSSSCTLSWSTWLHQ